MKFLYYIGAIPIGASIKRIMSTGNNKTSKIPENPLDVPSRPAVAVMMRDDTTVPVMIARQNSAIQKRGAVEMDEILFIKIC